MMDVERVEDKSVITGNIVALRPSTSSSPEASSGQVSVEELKQFTGHADIKVCQLNCSHRRKQKTFNPVW